ncbi:baseplate J/gp47 family protein [Leptospira alexanderi]|uniref:baseplate J/gp47 family protein n=1 Tax=Leptospira alexanderi TaxID=100053 RepID=UPI002014BB21|nr:Gp138 family membrane-puncturing spike protein [Leptospira alexanderi]
MITPEVLQEKLNRELSKIWTGLYGKIDSYDKTTLTATVKPLLQIPTEEGFRDLPLLVKLPVNVFYSGGILIIPDYRRGDIVYLAPSPHSIQNSIRGMLDKTQENEDEIAAPRFGLENCSVAFGIPTRPFKLPPTVQKPGLVICNATGNCYINITESDIELKSGMVPVEKSVLGESLKGILEEILDAITSGLTQRVASNSLTVFVNPSSSFSSVTNSESSSGGSERETDPELYARYLELVTTEKNSGALAYIKAQIENEPSVVSCSIRENKLNVPVDDMPANSMRFIVDGGSNSLVSNLIYKYKPAAIRLVGSIQNTIDDNLIYFDRPSDLPIFAKVEIWKNGSFDNNSVSFIKTAIVRTIGGIDSVSGVDYVYKGLGAGRNVVAFPIYSAIGNVTGVENLFSDRKRNRR